MTATARVLLTDRDGTVGTAWRFHGRYVLTAAHCLGTRYRPESEVTLQFGTERLRAQPARVVSEVDVALLEIKNETLPDGLSTLEIGSIKADAIAQGKLRWSADAFPVVGDGFLLPLTGTIRGFAEQMGRMIKLGVDDIENKEVESGRTQLSCASGAAVTYQGRAIGLFNSAIKDSQIGFATPIDVVAEVIPQVAERLLTDYPLALSGTRYLECDRSKQWQGVLEGLAAEAANGLLLYGSASEEHDTFLNRLRTFLKKQENAWGKYVEVAWRDCWSRDDYFGALSKALADHSDFERERLARLLVATTTGAKHVVVHPVIDVAKGPESLEPVGEYYGEFDALLEARSNVAGRGPLFIQPIAWTARSDRKKALRLVEVLKKKWQGFKKLPELLPFTDKDLQQHGIDPHSFDRWKGLRSKSTGAAYKILKEADRRQR